MTLSIINALEIALSADKQGHWDEAHNIISGLKDPLAYEIHAYLHRKEGDLDNALFWYGRAGISPFNRPLATEYLELESKLYHYIMASDLTDNSTGDPSVIDKLLEQIDDADTVIADGAYDGEPTYNKFKETKL